MNSGNFASKQSAIADSFTDDGLPGERFFFSSLQQREVVATLRYGIEARKGLILCTGDAGSGKSMLLHKLERELGADITCLMIADPYLSFGEIVRRLLRSLQPSGETESEAGSLDRCRELLRAQLSTGRITALAFDDAHHLRDEIIEKLLQTLISGGDGERDRNLAQVVLIGRPELKERLFQPPLRSLGSLVAVECRLQPLSGPETGDYIRQRLRAADLPEELFEHEALARIAHYSGGNFRQANALCERAIRTAQSSSRTQITCEIVDGAAKDLHLWQPQPAATRNSKFGTAAIQRPLTAQEGPPGAPRPAKLRQDQSDPFRFRSSDDDSVHAVGKSYLSYSEADNNRPVGSEDKNRLFIGSKYMVDYVRQRLHGANLPDELFEPDALERIASYSGGNFRQANALCERAMQRAQSSSRKKISPEIVDNAAEDLDLVPSRAVRKEDPRTTRIAGARTFSPPRMSSAYDERRRREHHDLYRVRAADESPEDDARTFSDYRQQSQKRSSRSLFIGTLISLALVVSAGVWLYSDTARQAVGALRGKLEDISTSGKTPEPEMKNTPVPPYEPPKEPTNSAPLPQGSATLPEYLPNIPTPPKFDQPTLPPVAPEQSPANPTLQAKKAPLPRAPAKVPLEGPIKPRYDLETEVSKAIQNRAIEGVRVSISEDIVFLDGRVATERQKRAAELAAHGVPGVRAVRNRITLR